MAEPKPARRIQDLRKTRVPAPAPAGGAASKAMFGGDGVIPLPVGTPILSPEEKKTLKQFGYKDGDPVPSNLPSLLADLKKVGAGNLGEVLGEVGQESQAIPSNFFEGVQDLRLPKEISIHDLEKTKRDEIVQALRLARQQNQEFKSVQSQMIPDAPPGVNEAIAAAAAKTADGDSLVEDDLRRQPPIPSHAPVAEPSSPPEPEVSAGGAELPKNCSHCGYDLSKVDDIEVTRDDKINWRITQEGQQRFTKDYSFLGGKIIITFRTLLSKESDQAYRQIALDGMSDLRGKSIQPGDTYWRNLQIYRLVMGIEKYWSSTTGPIEISPIDEIAMDPDENNTKLFNFVPIVTEMVFPTESLRRQIGAAFHRFGLLTEHLEAHADDENFWSAIDTQS